MKSQEEYTLCIIKPDAVKLDLHSEILDAIVSGAVKFDIRAIEVFVFTKSLAERFYAEHAGRPYFDNLIKHTMSGPCWAIALRAVDAVKKWRTIIGPTDPLKGDYNLHLRARFGGGVPNNALHGSDSVEAALREMAIIGGSFTKIVKGSDHSEEESSGSVRLPACFSQAVYKPEEPMINRRPVVKFQPIDATSASKLPVMATAGAAGRDLYAAYDSFISPGKTAKVTTGYNVEVPEGYELQIRSRSGLAAKGIVVANSPGTVDSDYRGELCVLLTNNSGFTFDIKAGDRIAQCLLAEVPTWDVEEVDYLSGTARGLNGFGSTGK